MRALGVLVICGGLLVVSAPATAHDREYESKLTIHKRVLEPQEEGTHRVAYRGRLFNDLNACIVGRKVKLFTDLGAFQQELHTADESRYRFVITFEGDVPEVYTKVKRVETPGPHDHVCLPDRTRVV